MKKGIICDDNEKELEKGFYSAEEFRAFGQTYNYLYFTGRYDKEEKPVFKMNKKITISFEAGDMIYHKLNKRDMNKIISNFKGDISWIEEMLSE